MIDLCTWDDLPAYDVAVARPTFSWQSLPCVLQIATVVAVVLLVTFVVLVYRAWRDNTVRKEDLDPQEITLGATAVGGFITVAVAGASVLLAGIGILLAFEPGGTPLPTRVFTDLTLAIGWLVVSIISGALAAAWIVSHVHDGTSVAEQQRIMAASAAQLVTFVLGAVYFMFGILLF